MIWFGTVLSQDPLMTPDIYSTKYLAIFTMACTMAITLGKPIGSRASWTTSISSRRCTWRLRLSSKGTETITGRLQELSETLERKSRRHWPKSKRGNNSNSRVLGIYCMLMYMMYVTCSNAVRYCSLPFTSMIQASVSRSHTHGAWGYLRSNKRTNFKLLWCHFGASSFPTMIILFVLHLTIERSHF